MATPPTPFNGPRFTTTVPPELNCWRSLPYELPARTTPAVVLTAMVPLSDASAPKTPPPVNAAPHVYWLTEVMIPPLAMKEAESPDAVSFTVKALEGATPDVGV